MMPQFPTLTAGSTIMSSRSLLKKGGVVIIIPVFCYLYFLESRHLVQQVKDSLLAPDGTRTAENGGRLLQTPDYVVLSHERLLNNASKTQNTSEITTMVPQKNQTNPATLMSRQKPSVPLRAANLAIVQKAKPVDLAHVRNHSTEEHPHLGARHANGTFGYIADATALRKNPPDFHFEALREACQKNDSAYKLLTERIFVDFKAHEAAEMKATSSVGRKRRVKIFCHVYTVEKSHPKIQSIRETWGPKCDGFIAASTKTDPLLNTVDIPHSGKEEYNNMFAKVQSMWSYVYDNYYENYDWFHIGGDDMYLLVENLRLYLESEEIQTAENGGIYMPNGLETSLRPLFLGRRFARRGDRNDIFASGGPGYTMNKAALKALVVDGFPVYFQNVTTSMEDVLVARTFRELGVEVYDTQDENGGERYMPLHPGKHYEYILPENRVHNKRKDWYDRFSINIKEGANHSSPTSVAFHYIKGDEMKRIHALLYNLCPGDTGMNTSTAFVSR